MGGTSKTTQTQTQQLAPYDPANPALQGILSGITSMVPQAGLSYKTSGALDAIEANAAKAGATFSPAITSGTLGLLNGGGATKYDPAITANLDTLSKGILGQTASGANIGNNPGLKAQLDQIRTDVTDQVNGAWAAAGRDGSPGNMQALARGIAAGTAPVIAAQYNADTDRAMNAATALYGAGNTTYGILNDNQAKANANFTSGVGTAGDAIDASNYGANAALRAEAQRFGIPASQYATLLGSIAPIAAQFGTNTGHSEGETQMSGAQQFALIASGLGSLWPKGNISFGAS
ncbi:tail fiber domain-containing protein [Bradyrhizobium sp. WSM 1738]|uniref:tail fiber domain-containing protein n=1 Tax=Bradyrhizobium hereditatis TaxID=2821405 RepID=UPI001CE391F4|nr:tail fiber domain-containing protein [Bradyrhizobium hereditatis]MCA6114244.1 tail fiber domain-containing protein [Bradyrhizobium hereditatis]